MNYIANENRYDTMIYRRCGKTGLKLPAVSLGLWHNFGGVDDYDNAKAMVTRAFDLGITHFDLANNYGPPAGSAEETLGKILQTELKDYRDELIISTKAGYGMWPGPYGDFGSRKYLIASLDQSLKRLGVDYVDVFYSHRPDPETSIEETMMALDSIVRQGKALYVGLSNYDALQTSQALEVLKDLKTPIVLHQPAYSMLNRWVEHGLLDVNERAGIGTIIFQPLAQGVLTDRYLQGIPSDSRAASESVFLNEQDINDKRVNMVVQLNNIAKNRGQSLAQLAISWALRDERVTSALIGASRVAQIEDNVKALNHLSFSEEELTEIEAILQQNS
ncbi:L-glyceraldehyde 3-phosphate reductase [Cytobacillus sp. IB215316]|uniref:L-glyceraldehyde 3-phosphate reductase n=1 Tax=Cytobacillus sp. IB215316 TaxID=3097354 RepID=UPI002A17569C|nr:L-glyceraldehyde 3-phosphate reductase [Cytobacillus sp. IB215316]MDX8361300.1 L-glyceraldehyde 3-phosphate reductase [Cytobacillus sp. IB215316]